MLRERLSYLLSLILPLTKLGTRLQGPPLQHNTAQCGYYSEATRRNFRAAKTIDNELSVVSAPRNGGEIHRTRASSDIENLAGVER